MEELQSLINQQLLRKLPVTSDEEQIHPEIKDYVCTIENERRSMIVKNISSAFTIDMKFSGNKSESILHYPIDAIEFHSKLLINILGEEKASSGEFNMAVEELEEKFNVLNPIYFGKIQFMIISYAAAGSTVRFYAIDNSIEAKKKPSILFPLISELNASNLVDRITILRTVVNIARILTISDNIPSTLILLEKMTETRRACDERLSGWNDNTLTKIGYYTTRYVPVGKDVEVCSSRISNQKI
ncbi:hypothetical protein C1646_755581 [Rhizophagus diaphanus]|nr:hypothetical protein C1646_755581 [Rhizophagus diaphanus] [Rhizophagus sp. MUCL 43196]